MDKTNPGEPEPPANPAPPVHRSPGHRGADMRDTVAELAERAQLISLEAGTKVAAAMKDVISAAAGIAGFAIESARDLVQYMVKRGQMTQDEADKLIRAAEDAHKKRPDSERARPTATKIAAKHAPVAKVAAPAKPRPVAKVESAKPVKQAPTAKKPVAKAAKKAAKPPAVKKAAKKKK